ERNSARLSATIGSSSTIRIRCAVGMGEGGSRGSGRGEAKDRGQGTGHSECWLLVLCLLSPVSCLLFLHLHRIRQRDLCSAFFMVGGAEGSAEAGGDVARQRQAQAVAVGLRGGVEAEDVGGVEEFARQARPVVGDADAN